MEKANPFREFLNVAGEITDRSEVDSDNRAVLDEYGHPIRYKSPELLELFQKFYKQGCVPGVYYLVGQ